MGYAEELASIGARADSDVGALTATVERLTRELEAALTPPPPPPPPIDFVLGAYPGIAKTDDGLKAAIGQYPMAASTYWQPGNYQRLSVVELERVLRGIHSVTLLAAAKDTAFSSAKATVVDTVAGNPPTSVIDYLKRNEVVAQAAREKGATVTVHPMGEIDVAFNQNASGSKTDLGSLFRHYSGDGVEVLKALGRYVNEFFVLADTHAPTCRKGYWMGGAHGNGTPGRVGANNQNRNLIFDQIEAPFDEVSADSYNNGFNPGETAYDTWLPDVKAYRDPAGAHHDFWVRTGRLPFVLNETGASHHRPSTGATVYTDAQIAAWISTMFDGMQRLKITRAMYWNGLSGTNGQQAITGGDYPLSCAALSRQLTLVKAAA